MNPYQHDSCDHPDSGCYECAREAAFERGCHDERRAVLFTIRRLQPVHISEAWGALEALALLINNGVHVKMEGEQLLSGCTARAIRGYIPVAARCHRCGCATPRCVVRHDPGCSACGGTGREGGSP